MNRIVILCVEDEPEVREAIDRDLEPFARTFPIEFAEDAEEGAELIRECTAQGDAVGLILCDHLLPGKRGVDFLVDLHRNPDTRAMRKVLITGQAGLDDTIHAINDAGLHYYIEKPWTPDDLHRVVREQLTEFVLDTGHDELPFVAVLDGPRLLEAARRHRVDR